MPQITWFTQNGFITLPSVFRGSLVLGPTTISHLTSSRHVPQPFPSHSLHCVVAVAGSAIITTTILNTTTTKTPSTLPYNSLARLHPAAAEQSSSSRQSLLTTHCDARDTTLRPLPPNNTTPGNASTPTALPIIRNRVFTLRSTKDPWISSLESLLSRLGKGSLVMPNGQ